jgi:hypothetical protein
MIKATIVGYTLDAAQHKVTLTIEVFGLQCYGLQNKIDYRVETTLSSINPNPSVWLTNWVTSKCKELSATSGLKGITCEIEEEKL